MSEWVGQRVTFRTDTASYGTGVVKSHNEKTDHLMVIDDEDGSAWQGYVDDVELADEDDED